MQRAAGAEFCTVPGLGTSKQENQANNQPGLTQMKPRRFVGCFRAKRLPLRYAPRYAASELH